MVGEAILISRDDLLAEPLTIPGGTLHVSGAPGIGVVLDPDKLAYYRTDT